MNSRLIGATFLVIGTSIGGGLLALPIATAQAGFIPAAALLIVCWLLMTSCSLLILEVNLWLPRGSNLVSMAQRTLGRPAKFITWISCLLLLYALICAYISGGSDMLANILHLIHINLPPWLNSCLFTLILGYIVYKGIHSVDYVNRGLMSIKLLVYSCLIILIMPHIDLTKLTPHHNTALMGSVTLIVTSFGFANIVPSLRGYLEEDVAMIRKAIFIGSSIALICYLLWICVIIGTVPLSGRLGLNTILHSAHATSGLTEAISAILRTNSISTFAHFFTSICVATSFLGVSIALSDFIADAFQTKKEGLGNVTVYALTFLPPLFIVIFYPGAFIICLRYAGILCVVLLMLLPSLMAWRGRYHQQHPGETPYSRWSPPFKPLDSCLLDYYGSGYLRRVYEFKSRHQRFFLC